MIATERADELAPFIGPLNLVDIEGISSQAGLASFGITTG